MYMYIAFQKINNQAVIIIEDNDWNEDKHTLNSNVNSQVRVTLCLTAVSSCLFPLSTRT